MCSIFYKRSLFLLPLQTVLKSNKLNIRSILFHYVFYVDRKKKNGEQYMYYLLIVLFYV